MPERKPAVPVVLEEAGADRLAEAEGDLGGGMLGQQGPRVLGGERLAKTAATVMSSAVAGPSSPRRRRTPRTNSAGMSGSSCVPARTTPSRIWVAKNGYRHAVQHAAEPGRRRPAEPVLGDGCDVGRAVRTELDDVGPGPGETRPLEVLNQAFPRTPAGEQPHDRSGQAGRQRPQDQPAHGIRPLRVVDSDQGAGSGPPRARAGR